METFLLDKESKSILEIIARVDQSPIKEMTFYDIEKELELAPQTVKAYLSTLLTYCPDTFTIEDKRIKMSKQTSFNVFKLYDRMTKTSVKYQILTTIFNNKDVTLTKLYLDLAISKSSASTYIRQINQTLKSYHCQIKFSKQKRLQGQEHQIRFVYHNLFWNLDIDDIIPDTSNLDAILADLLASVPHMTYSDLSRLKLYFYIFQVRSQDGYLITAEDDFKMPDMPYLSYQDFFDKLDAHDFFKHCPNLKTKQKESLYLYFIFCRINLLTLNDIKSIAFQTPPRTTPAVQDAINHFQQQIKFQLSQAELNFLNYNLTLLNQEAKVLRGRRKIFGATETINKVTTSKDKTMTFIWQFIKDIRQINPTIDTLILNFPTLYHDYALLIKALIEENRQPLRILVLSGYSPIYRQLMVDKVKSLASFPIEVYTSEQTVIEKPDGIISNFTPEKKYRDVPYFSTSLFYSDWNLTDLDHFLNQLADDKTNFFEFNSSSSEQETS